MGRGGFGGKNTKYKKIILAVFPTEPTGEIQIHNVGKLVHFCELTPQKLPKVAIFLDKRVDADLAKTKLGYVEISMKIFNELIKGCRKHIPLFSAYVLRLIRLLLEKNEYPELQLIATETFIKFAEVHDGTTQYNELEPYVSYFIAMCNSNLNNEQLKRRLRIQGLKGLRAFIGILDVADELDSFVSRQSTIKSQFFPTILDNMRYIEPAIVSNDPPNSPQLGGDDEARTTTSVKALATEVLRDLANRVNNITVTALTSAVLGYLDFQDKWIPNTFAVECLQTISFALSNQHNQIMMTKVLQHLEIEHSTRVTQQIVSTIVHIAGESTGSVVVVLSSLIKLLISTIQRVAHIPPAADVEEQLALQQILIDCVGAVSKKFPSPAQKVEAMGFILSLYSEGASRAQSGGFTLALVLAECVLVVGAQLVTLPSDCVPTHLFSILLELAVHSDPTVRVYAQRIIHCLLLPGRSLGQLVSIPHDDMNAVTGSGCDELLARQGTALRDTLIAAALMRTNQPENYSSIFHTLAILLYRGREKEIQYSIPIILKLQRKFQNKKRVPPLQSRSLHTLVAAYLLLVARLYECNPLVQHVNEVVAQRQEEGQQCRYLELKADGLVSLLVKTKKYSESAKHRSVTIFFDKTKVITALSAVPALQQEYSKEELPKMLGRKYRTKGKLKSEDSGTYTPSSISAGLPPLTPRDKHNNVNNNNAANEDSDSDTESPRTPHEKKPPAQCADEWPPATPEIVVKAVSADAIRKILAGAAEHAGQTLPADGVTLLLAAEHFGPAAVRCADSATEKAKTYTHIMALAVEREKVNNDNSVNMNGADSEDSIHNISKLSALRLDLLGPLGQLGLFCD